MYLLAEIMSATLAAATPICPDGVTVPERDVCPVSQPAPDLLADNLPFQNSFIAWESCERINGEERARRMGRAGPGGSPDLSGIDDCRTEATALQTIVESLPADGPREQAIAAIRQANEQIAATAAEVYQRNNYE